MKIAFVSIIIPTRNEEENLARLLRSINKLDYPKNKFEVIIVDGCSSDRTVAIAKKYKRAKILSNRGIIRSTGCQIGLEKARGEIIAFTDADCAVPKNWLKGLIKFINQKSVASVGGPNITPPDDVLFAKATGETLTLLTLAGARYGYHGKRVTEIFHNPGCNVIYKKESIKKIGGFNPSLITCEDEEMDFRLRKKGRRLLFTPSVIVKHYRRTTYNRMFEQIYRFAIGRAQAIKMHPPMARWFHFIPTIFLLSFLTMLLLSLYSHFFVMIAFTYILISLSAFLSIAFYLSVVNKHSPFNIYLSILCYWLWGWGCGFLVGLIVYPPFLFKIFPSKRLTKLRK